MNQDTNLTLDDLIKDKKSKSIVANGLGAIH